MEGLLTNNVEEHETRVKRELAEITAALREILKKQLSEVVAALNNNYFLKMGVDSVSKEFSIGFDFSKLLPKNSENKLWRDMLPDPDDTNFYRWNGLILTSGNFVAGVSRYSSNHRQFGSTRTIFMRNFMRDSSLSSLYFKDENHRFMFWACLSAKIMKDFRQGLIASFNTVVKDLPYSLCASFNEVRISNDGDIRVFFSTTFKQNFDVTGREGLLKYDFERWQEENKVEVVKRGFFCNSTTFKYPTTTFEEWKANRSLEPTYTNDIKEVSDEEIYIEMKKLL